MSRGIDRIREIWCEYIGFEPEALASFDHITVGLPSRILVGYEYLNQEYPGDRSVSVVVDTVLPRRERPCGVSMELGLVPDKITRYIADPDVFYYFNSFAFQFKDLHEQLAKAFDRIFGNMKRQRRAVIETVISDRIYRWSNLWRMATSSEDILLARDKLAEKIGLPSFQGKRILFSEMLPVVASVLDLLMLLDFKLEECPGADKGLARAVNADGTEGELILETPGLVEAVAQARAIPTVPIIILAVTVASGFNHFGNDYGLIQDIASWLRVDPPRTTGDGRNSWPAGEIIQQKRKHANAFVDLVHFPCEMYGILIQSSVKERKPAFSRKFGDFLVY